jgi:hypothetical protein
MDKEIYKEIKEALLWFRHLPEKILEIFKNTP